MKAKLKAFEFEEPEKEIVMEEQKQIEKVIYKRMVDDDSVFIDPIMDAYIQEVSESCDELTS